MDLQKIFQNVLEIVQLKEEAFQRVAVDPEATKPALMLLFLSALALNLGQVFFPVHVGVVVYRPDLFWVLSHTAALALVAVVGLYACGFLLEKLFKVPLRLEAFVRVIGYAGGLGLLLFFATLVPFLQIGLGIWELVILCVFLSRVGKMTPFSIVLFVLVAPLAIFAAMGFLLFS